MSSRSSSYASGPTTQLDRLSPRERDVLALMAKAWATPPSPNALRHRRRRPQAHPNIFAKLELAPTDRADRRVTAVLHYLEDANRRL